MHQFSISSSPSTEAEAEANANASSRALRIPHAETAKDWEVNRV